MPLHIFTTLLYKASTTEEEGVMKKIAGRWLLAWILGIYSCIAGDAFDDRRPQEHFCPILLEVMKNPVVADDGHSYEKNAISRHLATSNISPATGAPLRSKVLFDNHTLKTMIREWKPGIQDKPSVLATRDSDSIAQQIRQEFKKNAALLNSAKGQHIVAFLGNTGAGKSTLVNFLAGKEMKVSEDEEDYVLANPEDKTAMLIGTGGKSETLYPKSIDVEGLRFFDLPGFNDTDGSERNLVNAAFTRQILLDAASVRLVFVVGQDQFTADRSASIKQMFNCLKQLFIVDEGINLVNEGVFVATKTTWNEKTELTDFLIKKTNTQDKEELVEQLTSWRKADKIGCVFHPMRAESNKDAVRKIFKLIQGTKPAKVHGINVSALYPPDTKGPLERMFIRLFEEALEREFRKPLKTLSGYDRAMDSYESKNFWQGFNATICREDEAVNLIREFCITPYNQAFRKIEAANEGKRKEHIQSLKDKRQARVEDIERRTIAKAKGVISSLVPSSGDSILFDFAYHKDFYDRICGPDSINQLATDNLEQEVVRRSYAGFIGQHSHEQKKFSGMAAMEESLRALQPTQAKEEKERGIAVPLVAKGYEEVYRRFLKGVLIYRPQEGSDAGRIDMPIAALKNPLEGTFDLSRCGDTAQYLSISTGYRKAKKAENKDKVEIWFSPRFLIQHDLETTAGHFKKIEGKWAAEADVGIFWTWGSWDTTTTSWYDYLTSQNMENLSKNNLYKNWQARVRKHVGRFFVVLRLPRGSIHKKFQLCFLT